MTEYLQHAGVTNPHEIDHYTLRSESDNDVLKIYYRKEKGHIFSKSVKLKFPRHLKNIPAGCRNNHATYTSEIDANLVHILAELDILTNRKTGKQDKKAKLLADLKHLEKVFMNKIKEIEEDIEAM